MAGGALSFFSRLFSSKKKKILEKRREEKFISDSQLDYSLNVNKESLKPSDERATENAGFGAEAHETDLRIKKTSGRQVYAPNETQVNFSQAYSENTHIGVSTASVVKPGVQDGVESPDRYGENHRINQEQSQTETQNSSEDISHDDSLEYDSMVLLSKLEQLMIKLGDGAVQKSVPLVIEYLVEMANDIVEFANRLPGAEQRKSSLHTLLGRDEKKYKILNPSYIENDQLVVASSAVTESSDPGQMFIDLSNDLLHLINVYLSASVKVFKSNQISEQWKTLYNGFFVNLTKSVRSSQANQQN